MSILDSLVSQAQRLKQQVLTVYFVARNPQTPFAVRALAFLVAAYALSPVDLIPDFIPVIGYLDDLVLVPLGLAVIVRLTPPAVLDACRAQAQDAGARPVSYGAAVFIVALWILLLWIAVRWAFGASGQPQ